MAHRARDIRMQALLRAVILGAILVLVALLSANWFVRADLTARREFTVSSSTRSVLEGLPDIVAVTVYMSEDLPQHLTGFRTRIDDVLSEYRAFGGDRIRISYVDPASDPETEREARQLGILPVQLQAVERDRAEIVNVYVGMAVRFEDRQEVIPILSAPDRLEYDLTSAILKVMARRIPTVGFLSGHGERGIAGDYAAVAGALADQYEVVEVILEDGGQIPPGVTTLVVAGPRRGIPDPELYQIDQFIMRGGRVFFLIDAVTISPSADRAEPVNGTIFDYVSSYGATVNADLVVDRVVSNASFQSGIFTLAMPYAYWPKAVPPNISRENPVVSDLDAIPFPWTSSITVADLPDGVEATELARSSSYSWTVPPTADLNPRQDFRPEGPDAAEITRGLGKGEVLAVSLVGQFTSAFAERPLIIERDGRPEVTEPEDRITKGRATQIILLGNSRMFEDRLIAQLPGNLTLFLNAIDWLTLGDDLIGIRSKEVRDRPIRPMADRYRATVKFLGTFAVPALVVLFGLTSALLKRKRRALRAGRTAAERGAAEA